MNTDRDQGPSRPISKIRLVVLVLALTLVVFGIIGALVTFIPQTKHLPTPEVQGKAPQVRQLDRENFHR